MPKHTSKAKKKTPTKMKEIMAYPMGEPNHQQVGIEKVEDGYIVNRSVDGPKGYENKKYIAKTKKEAHEKVAKLLK